MALMLFIVRIERKKDCGFGFWFGTTLLLVGCFLQLESMPAEYPVSWQPVPQYEYWGWIVLFIADIILWQGRTKSKSIVSEEMPKYLPSRDAYWKERL